MPPVLNCIGFKEIRGFQLFLRVSDVDGFKELLESCFYYSLTFLKFFDGFKVLGCSEINAF